MTGPTPPLPTFLIIGAQKSATRWLRHNLGGHPEIATAPQEVKFFNHPKRIAALGVDWYRQQFTTWSGEAILGEATPGYMMLRHGPADVARRIDEMLPDVRLLAVLRDPVDRANSALVHHRRRDRIRPGVGLVEQLRSVPPDEDWMGLVEGGLYAASLEPYLARFGSRLRVLLYDDLRVDPTGVFADAVAHVGGTAGFVPDSLHAVVSSNQADEPALSAEDRAAAFAWFRADVERLEVMLGRDLSAWRPT